MTSDVKYSDMLFFLIYIAVQKLNSTKQKTSTIKQILILLEAVVHRCSSKYMFLKTCNFIKKRLQRRCFPVKFARFFTKCLRWRLWSFWNKCSHKYIHRKMPVTVSFLLQLQVLGLTVLRKMETSLDAFVKFEEFYWMSLL